jgi:thiol-disulfide isomerase/thioredoxin
MNERNNVRKLNKWISILLIIASVGFAQEMGEVAVVPGDTTKDPGLKPGDLAPSWALMYAPGKFEFLKNWTVERNLKLRKFMSQPDRYPVVLSFFATWCVPCMKELPHLENVYQAYKNEKVKFFLVDITEATRTGENENSPKAGPFLAEKGVTIPILYDNRGVAKERYGAKTLPRLFVIDKFQIIREARQGFHEGEDLEGELSALIDELMAEDE